MGWWVSEAFQFLEDETGLKRYLHAVGIDLTDFPVLREGVSELSTSFEHMGQLHGVPKVVRSKEGGPPIVLKGLRKLLGALERHPEVIVACSEVGIEPDCFL